MMELRVFAEKFPLVRAHKDDAGWDLRAIENVIIKPGEVAVIRTGIYLVMPEGYYGQIFGRSSYAAKGIDTFGGVIDSGYRGEVKVVLYNSTDENFVIAEGDKVAQIIFFKIPDVEVIIEISDDASKKVKEFDSHRGEKGFGSTGR